MLPVHRSLIYCPLGFELWGCNEMHCLISKPPKLNNCPLGPFSTKCDQHINVVDDQPPALSRLISCSPIPANLLNRMKIVAEQLEFAIGVRSLLLGMI